MVSGKPSGVGEILAIWSLFLRASSDVATRGYQSQKEDTHSEHLRLPFLEKEAFNVTYAQRSSFTSASDLIYKFSLAHFLGSKTHGKPCGSLQWRKQQCRKAYKILKTYMDKKKICFVMLSGTSNLHHFGRSHSPRSHSPLHGYSPASSTIQLELYRSVPPAGKKN